MTAYIDELHTVIRNTLWAMPYADVLALSAALHDAHWAPADPYTVATTAELDAYPVRTVVLGHDDTAYQRVIAGSFCWSAIGAVGRLTSEYLFTALGPVRIAYRPGRSA